MTADRPDLAPQWTAVELSFALPGPGGANPYRDADVTATFRHDGGETITRPAFWAGGATWRVRFASTQPAGTWRWRLNPTGETGSLTATPPDERHPHPARRHGFLRPSTTARTMVHADGTAHVVVADTPWAMPWRARPEDAETYARRRAAQGFTAALLMTVQPDMRADGPDARNTDEGFARGFRDLPQGHLDELDPTYFDTLDLIVDALVAHGITPVLQPVFFGFGWKGLDVAGPVVPPAEYARYCRYLVARYGAGPVMYLVGADGSGTEPAVAAGGGEIERVDAYGQPTGIHYRPHARNDAHQDADWLDFQWCQTGHGGEHVPERVADMWRNRPAKAIMNGEPTYEQTRGLAGDWWQGHEAWSNLCAGATMGVAYGAASLWQWRLHPDEPGHAQFFLAPDAGWREALDFPGADHVGRVGRILAGLPTAGLAPCWDVGLSTRGLLDPGVLYVAYAENGGPFVFLDADGRVPDPYWVVDPRDGTVVDQGERPADGVIDQPYGAPRVLLCSERTPAIASGVGAELA